MLPGELSVCKPKQEYLSDEPMTPQRAPAQRTKSTMKAQSQMNGDDSQSQITDILGRPAKASSCAHKVSFWKPGRRDTQGEKPSRTQHQVPPRVKEEGPLRLLTGGKFIKVPWMMVEMHQVIFERDGTT